MDDGFPTPKAMDGMAAFPGPNGNIVLVRNHEDGQAGNTLRPRPAGSTSTSAGILAHRLETHYGPRAFAFDAYAAGGTTTLEVEPHGQRRLVSQHWSLVGTVRNCAGGLTPWGSWISSEETLENASAPSYAQNHGYNFEVPIDTRARDPGAAGPAASPRDGSRTRRWPWTLRPARCTRPKIRAMDPGSTGTCLRHGRSGRAIWRRAPACFRC